MHATARLIVDTPSRNADLYYACGFDVPDPCIFLQIGQRRYLLLGDLELDRGRRAARVEHVCSLTEYRKRAVQARWAPDTTGVVRAFCREHRIRQLLVPASTAAALVDALRTAGLRVTTRPSPFYPARFLKTPQELRALADAQRATFRAMRRAEIMLRESTIGRNGLLRWQGKVLTAEAVKADLETGLLHANYGCPEPMIVACGPDSIEPHNRGSGPLRAHTAIIVDIFPRSRTTHFFGDGTRTFCKGAPPPALQRMYDTVRRAQLGALRAIRAGVDGRSIHGAIVDAFTRAGYVTGEQHGRMQGFIHGTGHGLGLDIHEEPLRISATPCRLRAGHVVTVEPGLYYEAIGGVRIEDAVVVTKTGCRLLGTYPKRLVVP